ncbi:hypothetical protein D3C80_1937500 [compost metagenome]
MIRQYRQNFRTGLNKQELDFLRIYTVTSGKLRQHIGNFTYKLDAGQAASADKYRCIGRIFSCGVFTDPVFNMRMNVFGVFS